MNANDVIESYVNEVALQLPRKQRNDVAFELHALLNEELGARAEASGQAIDAATVVDFLQGFGTPAEVAARYRPTLTIIAPEDGHRFLRITLIGLLVIWGLGLIESLREANRLGLDWLSTLGLWWGSVVLPSPWWPGVLVVGFGLASWARRRPGAARWEPRAGDRLVGGRAALILGVAAILCSLWVLFDPRWILDVFFDGGAAPAAYEALTYTESFRQRQGPVLFFLLLLNVPLLIAAIVNGRWSPAVRRMYQWLGYVVCAVMVWTILDGPIFAPPASNLTAKFLMGLILFFVLLDLGWQWLRRVRPAPARR